MNIPDLFNALSSVAFLNGQPLALLILLSAVGLFLARPVWGQTVLLWLVFFGLGLLITPLYPARVGFAVWMGGLFTAAILAFTGRQIRQQPAATPPLTAPSTLIWQIGAPLLLLASAWALSQWPAVQFGESAAITWVVWGFLLLAALRFFRARQPLPLGIAFIIGLSGLGLVQAILLHSHLLIGFWIGMVLLTAVLTAYLMQQQTTDTAF